MLSAGQQDFLADVVGTIKRDKYNKLWQISLKNIKEEIAAFAVEQLTLWGWNVRINFLVSESILVIRYPDDVGGK